MGATGLPQDRSGQKPKAGGILAFSRKNQEDAPSDDMPFTKRRVAIILARLVLKVAQWSGMTVPFRAATAFVSI